jgi:hypothetical protein
MAAGEDATGEVAAGEDAAAAGWAVWDRAGSLVCVWPGVLAASVTAAASSQILNWNMLTVYLRGRSKERRKAGQGWKAIGVSAAACAP